MFWYLDLNLKEYFYSRIVFFYWEVTILKLEKSYIPNLVPGNNLRMIYSERIWEYFCTSWIISLNQPVVYRELFFK